MTHNLDHATARGTGLAPCLLATNAFWTLGVGTRDTAAQIIESSTNPLLADDSSTIERARFALTNPRARVASEIGWLPGVAPARARQIVAQLIARELPERAHDGLPSWARANVVISNIQLSDAAPAKAEARATLLLALDAMGATDLDAVLREINEDRAVALMPTLRSTELLQEAADEQVRRQVAVLADYLDRLPANSLIETVTEIVSARTSDGTEPGDAALELLVDAYDARVQPFLEAESESIRRLCDAILENAAKGEAHIAPAVSRIFELLRNWSAVAQPISLIRKSSGQTHLKSREVAYTVRGLAVDLVNQFDLLAIGEKITSGLGVVFSWFSEFIETTEKDSEALSNLGAQKKERDAAEAALEYAVHVGLSKTLFSIGGREIVWGRARYALDEIDHIKWGATRHSINGIPTGTTYKMAFGSGTRQSEVTMGNGEVFAQITTRLWRGVGVRLAVQTLQRLAAGEKLRIGGIVFTNNSVFLSKSKIFGRPDTKVYAWKDVKILSSSGQFVVLSVQDRGAEAKASYQDDANTHVISNILSNAFGKGIVRLSELLA